MQSHPHRQTNTSCVILQRLQTDTSSLISHCTFAVIYGLHIYLSLTLVVPGYKLAELTAFLGALGVQSTEETVDLARPFFAIITHFRLGMLILELKLSL